VLTKRIIACLDVRGGRVVKGVQFVDIVDAGDPAELAVLKTELEKRAPQMNAGGPILGGKSVRKVIVVPMRIVNVVG